MLFINTRRCQSAAAAAALRPFTTTTIVRASALQRPKMATQPPAAAATSGGGGGGGGGYTYQWPRPALTVDAAIVSAGRGAGDPCALLLIQRKHAPCKGAWALPGGFVDEGEPLEAAAARELEEETGLSPGGGGGNDSSGSGGVALHQVGAFGDPGRDPRGWTVTVAYTALVGHAARSRVEAADDAADARWFDLAGDGATALPPLAFDHRLVVRRALRRLAEAPEAAAVKAQLEAAAARLDGPWVPPTE